MKIWVFYEGDKFWGVRAGNRWLSARSVDIRVPVKGKTRKGPQPTAYLEGEGRVEMRGQRARIVK